MSMRTIKQLIAYAVERAPHERDKAEDVLRFLCDAVDSGKAPDEAILKYLAERFRLILSGTPPDVALNLHGSRGQRTARTLARIDEQHFDLAYAVVTRMEKGMKRDDAFADVAVAEGASVAIVKRAYETYGAAIRAYQALPPLPPEDTK
jgi:hypothetical protein